VTMDPRRVYLFLGAPGSGKGTLSKQCVASLDFEQLSTGNLLREHIARGSEIGKKIDLDLKSGKLVDDELMSSLVVDWLSDVSARKRDIILDGFPRTLIQASSLNRFMCTQEDVHPLVVRLAISDHAVIERLTMRFLCSDKGCQAVYSLAPGSSCCPRVADVCDVCSSPLVRRNDDEVEAIKHRLDIYHGHESALLDFYRSCGYEVVELDAARSVDSIFDDLRQTLGRNA
jgi:adenylate kinase